MDIQWFVNFLFKKITMNISKKGFKRKTSKYQSTPSE